MARALFLALLLVLFLGSIEAAKKKKMPARQHAGSRHFAAIKPGAILQRDEVTESSILVDGGHLSSRRSTDLAPLSSVAAAKTANGFLNTAKSRRRQNEQGFLPTKTYFYHVHKGAGSETLRLAEGALDVGPVVQWTATTGLSWAKIFHNPWAVQTQRAQFVSNEHYLDDPDRMPWDSFRCFLTTARHPIERAFSHFLHVQRERQGKLARKDFAEWLEAQPDNFFVRRFCGYSCRDIPQGQLTQTHLNMALDNLYRFDVVVDIDHFAEGVAVYCHLVGANTTPLDFVQLTHPPSHRKSILFELTASELQLAITLSSLDLLFYEHAIFIAHSLIAELTVSVIEMTVTSVEECTDPCCGPCSVNEFDL